MEQNNIKLMRGSKFIRKDGKLIRWWMGSDVLKTFYNPYPRVSLQHYSIWIDRLFNFFCKFFVDENWVVHGLLEKPLNNYGIYVNKIVHDPAQNFENFERKKHDEINILYYYPKKSKNNQAFIDWRLGWDIIQDIMLIFREDAIFIRADGTQNMSEIYPIVDYYIRPSRWDGMPRMVLECRDLGIPYFWDETFKPTTKKVEKWLDSVI